jgi:hypothetical protein
VEWWIVVVIGGTPSPPSQVNVSAVRSASVIVDTEGIADAGYVLLHGNLPRPTAYGGHNANDLFPDTGHDLIQLFGRQARLYLETWVDPEELAAS